MRRNLLLLVLMSLATTTMAQVETGTVLLGGGGSLSYSSISSTGSGTGSGSSSTTVTIINLSMGYFVGQNFALGMKFGSTSVGNTSLSSFGGFFRGYPGGKVFLGAGYLSNSSGNQSRGEFQAEFGYAAFVKRIVAFEPALNYTSGDGYSVFGFSVGISVYLNRPD